MNLVEIFVWAIMQQVSIKSVPQSFYLHLKFLNGRHFEIKLSFVCSCIRPTYTMYNKNYAPTFAQHINLCTNFETNRMILAAAIAIQSDRNAENKNFLVLNKRKLL